MSEVAGARAIPRGRTTTAFLFLSSSSLPLLLRLSLSPLHLLLNSSLPLAHCANDGFISASTDRRRERSRKNQTKGSLFNSASAAARVAVGIDRSYTIASRKLWKRAGSGRLLN